MTLNLKEFSIRYPEFPKYLWESPTPYSDVMQIKKDRRNPDHTKRPLNAFMLFAKIQRESITSDFSCNHSEISKALGKLWQQLGKEEKEPFISGGKTLVELHRIEYPDYKYRPRKKGQAKDSPVKSASVSAGKKTATASSRRSKASTKTTDKLHKANIKKEPCHHHPSDHDQLYNPLHPVGTPASPLRQERNITSGSPSPLAAPTSPLSYGSLSPSSVIGMASPDSGLSMASPASHLHTPCSPVPSHGSSSGYDSEISHSCPPTQDPLTGSEDLLQNDCWSPLPEPDMAQELQDLEVTPLDGASFLNPLAMFPTLDINTEDLDCLDDLQLSL